MSKTHLNKEKQIIKVDFYLQLQNTENFALSASSIWVNIRKTLHHDCLKVISEVLNAITCNQKLNLKACKDIHPKSLYRLKLKKKVNREEDGSKDNSNEPPWEQIIKSNVTGWNESIVCGSSNIKLLVISNSCNKATFVMEDLVKLLGIKRIETSVVVEKLNAESKESQL